MKDASTITLAATMMVAGIDMVFFKGKLGVSLGKRIEKA